MKNAIATKNRFGSVFKRFTHVCKNDHYKQFGCLGWRFAMLSILGLQHHCKLTWIWLMSPSGDSQKRTKLIVANLRSRLGVLLDIYISNHVLSLDLVIRFDSDDIYSSKVF